MSLKPICLINPVSPFLLDERVFMSLGILKIAAVLERSGRPVEFLDLSGIVNYEDALIDYLANTDCTIFGLTATTPQFPSVVRILNVIRDRIKGAKVILGGPHVTLVNAAYKREITKGTEGRGLKSFTQLIDLFDVVVAGDGEEAIFHALDPFAPKVIDADDSKSPLWLSNSKFDDSPFPARHLIDVDSYRYFINNERALSLIAQLGCPYNCGFCGGRDSSAFRRIRQRSSENIVEEIVHLHHEYGVKGFMMYDDELNVNPKIIEFLNLASDAQREIGVEFQMRGFIKSNLFTNEQAEALYRAGFRWILVGFESGSPKILKNINKRATRDENTRCMEIANRHGLKVKALMSVGHPGESEETIKATRDWLVEVKPDDFDVTIITTYPGSPYFDHAVPHPTEKKVWVYTYGGDNLYSVELDYAAVPDYYKGDPEGGYKSYVYTDYLSAEDLVNLRNKMEKDVRNQLNIPFNPSSPAIRYEHSMGQSGPLPDNILRTAVGSWNNRTLNPKPRAGLRGG